MTIRLRGHHLLCTLTYVGKGYDATFVENYDRVVARLNAGEDVRIVEGPDDICAPLLGEKDAHCFGNSPGERDRAALTDLSVAFGRPIAPGTILELDKEWLKHSRTLFAAHQTRSACAGCQWFALCSEVAANGYERSRLFGS